MICINVLSCGKKKQKNKKKYFFYFLLVKKSRFYVIYFSYFSLVNLSFNKNNIIYLLL